MRLIGELSTRSRSFRSLWAAHDVIRHLRGAKRYRHPDVGELEFDYESYDLTTEPGLTMLVYTYEPHSATADRMVLLGSLHTPNASQATASDDRSADAAPRQSSAHPTTEER